MAPADSVPREPAPCSPPDSSLESYLLPTRPARRPAPYASDTSPGVTPPSGLCLVFVCIQPSHWARRLVGAVEHGGSRFLRPDAPPWRGAGVRAPSPRHTSAPRAELPLSIHVRSGPFFFFFLCCPGGRGTASPGTRPTSPRSGTRLSWFPRPYFSSCGNCRPSRPLMFTPRYPFLCLQLDAFSISLNVPSPVVCRTRPPDLACSWA